MNFVCMKLGWEPVIVKDANKHDYYMALELADSGDLSGIEAITQSELEWSLKKAIAAAKGEDIEDADDIDKEIDIFVRENAPSSQVVAKNIDDINQIIDSNIERLYTGVDAIIKQFEQFFTSAIYCNNLPLTDMDINGKPLSIPHGYDAKLIQFIGANENTNIKIFWQLNFGNFKYRLECVPYLNNGGTQYSLDWKQYTERYSQVEIDEILKEVKIDVFNLIRTLTNNSNNENLH